jgi:hypothetical protein
MGPAATSTAREVMEMLRRLPANVTIEEIAYEVFVLEEHHLAEQAIREGRRFSLAEVEERFRQWLTP